MTPGESALREAAALETARVYGQTCPEYRPPKGAAALTVRPQLRVIHSRPQTVPNSGQPAA